MEKEKKFNEKESLELISSMIQLTKENLQVGGGNVYLIYGYSSVFISLLMSLLVYVEVHPAWQFLWFLMFVPTVYIAFNSKNAKVVTYTDKAIGSVWRVVLYMFIVSIVCIIAMFYILDFGMGTLESLFDHIIIILPFGIIFIAMGTAITGVLLGEKVLMYLPIIGVVLSILSIADVLFFISYMSYFYFAISSIILLVVPGHILNKNHN